MTQRTVTLTIDDAPVEVPEGSTILDACTQRGIDTPTLCFGETLQPANVCRGMVIEFLASSVDLSTTPAADDYVSRYDAQPERYGPPAPPDNEQFLNGLEQGGTFEHVSLGLQRVLDRLNTA